MKPLTNIELQKQDFIMRSLLDPTLVFQEKEQKLFTDAFEGLTSLNLMYFTPTPQGWLALKKALESNTTLQLIHTNGVEISLDLTQEQILMNRNIQVWRGLDDLGKRGIIIHFLQNPKAAGAQKVVTELLKGLKILDISNENITPEGAKVLAKAIENSPTLETLYLSNNNIGDVGAAALAKAIEKCQTLKALFLNGNNIGNTGAARLAEAVENSRTLKALILNDNNIGDAGAARLAEAIERNLNLVGFNISDQKLEDPDFIQKREEIRLQLNCNIRIAKLSGLNTQEKAYMIADLLNNPGRLGQQRTQKVLKKLLEQSPELDLSNVKITYEGFKALAIALDSNVNVTRINYDKQGLPNELISHITFQVGASLKLVEFDTLDDQTKQYQFVHLLCDPTVIGQQKIIKELLNRVHGRLDFGNWIISPAGFESLARALESNVTVTNLNYNIQGLPDALRERINNQLHINRFIANLSNQSEEEKLAMILSALIKLPDILTQKVLPELLKDRKQLNLANIKIPPTGLEALAEALKQTAATTEIINYGIKQTIDSNILQRIEDLLERNRRHARGLEGVVNPTVLPNPSATPIQSNPPETPELILDAIVVTGPDIISAQTQNIAEMSAEEKQSEIKKLLQGLGDSKKNPEENLRELRILLTDLKELNLAGAKIGDVGIRALATVLKGNTTLKKLDLTDNDIVEGIEVFAEVLNKTALQDLNLSFNNFKFEGVKKFAKALEENETLEVLNFEDTEVGDLGIAELAKALEKNGTLLIYKFKDTEALKETREQIAKFLECNLKIKENRLNYESKIGKIGDFLYNLSSASDAQEKLRILQELKNLLVGMKAVGFTIVGQSIEQIKISVEALKGNKTVKKISFEGILDGGAEVLAELLKDNEFVTTVNLTKAGIGDRGVQVIATALESNEVVTTLNLKDNTIGVLGFEALAKLMQKNKTVTHIDLPNNPYPRPPIRDPRNSNQEKSDFDKCEEFIKQINDSLTDNRQESSLDNGQNITKARRNKIIELLQGFEDGTQKNPRKELANLLIGLTSLELHSIGIGDKGAEALEEAIRENKTLKILDLAGNDIGDVGAKALAKNKTLTTLNLSANKIGDVGAKALAENRILENLILVGNEIGDVGAIALAKNKTMKTLNLLENKIEDLGTKALKENKAMETKLGNFGDAGGKVLPSNDTKPIRRALSIFSLTFGGATKD